MTYRNYDRIHLCCLSSKFLLIPPQQPSIMAKQEAEVDAEHTVGLCHGWGTQTLVSLVNKLNIIGYKQANLPFTTEGQTP